MWRDEDRNLEKQRKRVLAVWSRSLSMKKRMGDEEEICA